MNIQTLWYTRCPAPTAATIAIRQGWLEQEFAAVGIAVRSLASSTDPEVHQSHYRHTQPNSFRFGGYVPPLIARSRGADLKVVGISWHDRVHGIFALPESGIRRPEDLKGRRLSVPVRKNDDIDWWRASVLGGYEALFARGAVAREDVQFVEIPIYVSYMDDATPGAEGGQSLWGAQSQFAVQREEIAALFRGEVDAVYSDGAMGAILRSVTRARLVAPLPGNEDDGTGFGTPCVLTASGELVRRRPDLVGRWISRHFAANRWIADHHDEARSLFARETGLPEDLLDLGYSPRLLGQADVSLAPGRVALLKSKYDYLLAEGFLAAAFDFDELIDERPLSLARAL